MRKLTRYEGLLDRNVRGMARRIEDPKTLAAYTAQVETLKKNVAKGDFTNVKKAIKRMKPELLHEIRYTVAAILRHTGLDEDASIHAFKIPAGEKKAKAPVNGASQ